MIAFGKTDIGTHIVETNSKLKALLFARRVELGCDKTITEATVIIEEAARHLQGEETEERTATETTKITDPQATTAVVEVEVEAEVGAQAVEEIDHHTMEARLAEK